MTNLRIDTAGIEEEVVLEMEVEDTGEGEEEGEGNQKSLSALEFLTQDAEPIRTRLVDARKGFNKLIRLSMLWIAQHQWLSGARFAFNCYRHWEQLLLR